MLTNDELTDLIEYEPFSGTIYRAGSCVEVDFSSYSARLKPLRRQNMAKLPIKPRCYKPSHYGYNIINKKYYDEVMSGIYDGKGEVQWDTKTKRNKRSAVRDRNVYERHYRVRVKGDTKLETKTYYMIEAHNRVPRLSVKGKQYTVTHLIYLYMGVEIPHDGVPCHDGIKSNIAWDNIKPHENRTPKPVKIAIDKRPVTTTYTYARCIESYFGGFRVTIHTNLTYYDTHAQALAGFAKITSKLQGKHKDFPNGVRVTRPHNSAYFKP